MFVPYAVGQNMLTECLTSGVVVNREETRVVVSHHGESSVQSA